MPNKTPDAPSPDLEKSLQQAVEYHQSNRLQDAERLYRGILHANARHPDANHNMGVLLVQVNQPETALSYLKTALEVNPEQGQYWISYIDGLIKAGDLNTAYQVLQQAQQRGLRGPTVDNLLQRIQLSSHSASQHLFTETQKRTSSSPSGRKPKKNKKKRVKSNVSIVDRIRRGQHLKGSSNNLKIAIREYQSGNLTAAKQILQEIVTADPRNVNALWHLSLVAQQLGNLEEAILIVKKSLSVDQGFFNGYNSLGLFYFEAGKLDASASCLKKAIAINSSFAPAFNNFGMVLYKLGHGQDAQSNFEKAIALEPNFVQAHNNLGIVLRDTGQLAEAEAAYRRALSFRPDYAEAYNNLGIVLKDAGRLTEAEAAYRQALSLKPDYVEAHNNLGIVLNDIGRLAEAEAAYRQALSFKPDYFEVHSNLLFSLNFNSSRSAGECLAEAQRYGAKLTALAQPYIDWPALKRDSPPLRVGLVSGDLKRHPVGYFLEKTLAHLAGNQIELLAYVTQPFEDDLTGRFKSCFTTWRSLVGLGDEEAARCIHDDGVHILIDLAGHTAKNRLPIFAWKPAPVQVTWLGYFATTGIEQMDYLLADRAGIPLDQQPNFSEQIWYLPETRLCFSPPDVNVPVMPLPALKRGDVTFGCFQNLSKLNDDVLALWGRILSELPTGVLRLQSMELDDAAVCNQLLERLDARGINTDKVVLCGRMSRADYLAAYADVDILLDTFPYPGGTTTCEALWMGVPTLTLAGKTLLERQGVSLLTTAGLPEWVAESQEEYVAKAVDFAGDLPELARLREGLRERVAQSPLFDAARFAGNLEESLLAMWKCWCEKKPRNP